MNEVIVVTKFGNVSVMKDSKYSERMYPTEIRRFTDGPEGGYEYKVTRTKKRTGLLICVEFDETPELEFEGKRYVINNFKINCYENVLQKVPTKKNLKRERIDKKLLEQIKEKIEGRQEIVFILRGEKTASGEQLKAGYNADGSLCVPVVILGDKVAKYDYHYPDLFYGEVKAVRRED